MTEEEKEVVVEVLLVEREKMIVKVVVEVRGVGVRGVEKTGPTVCMIRVISVQDGWECFFFFSFLWVCVSVSERGQKGGNPIHTFIRNDISTSPLTNVISPSPSLRSVPLRKCTQCHVSFYFKASWLQIRIKVTQMQHT